jgi:hypothetical protein
MLCGCATDWEDIISVSMQDLEPLRIHGGTYVSEHSIPYHLALAYPKFGGRVETHPTRCPTLDDRNLGLSVDAGHLWMRFAQQEQIKGAFGWSRHFKQRGRLRLHGDAGGELSMGSHLTKLRFGQYTIAKSVM